MLNKLAILLALTVACVFARPVQATSVEFEFSGFINAVYSNENNALGNVYIAQPFEGWFTYSSVPDQYPTSPSTGHYFQHTSISVALDSQTLSYIDAVVYIRVYDNYSSGDTFSFGVDASQGDFDFTNYGVRFSDSTGTVFIDDSLPMSFDLAQFDDRELTIAGYRTPNGDWFHVTGEVTSLTLVPEPGTVFLFGLAGVGLLRRHRRYRKR